MRRSVQELVRRLVPAYCLDLLLGNSCKIQIPKSLHNLHRSIYNCWLRRRVLFCSFCMQSLYRAILAWIQDIERSASKAVILKYNGSVVRLYNGSIKYMRKKSRPLERKKAHMTRQPYSVDHTMSSCKGTLSKTVEVSMETGGKYRLC